MNYLNLSDIVPQTTLAASVMIVIIVLIIKRSHMMTNSLTVLLLTVSAFVVLYRPAQQGGNSWLFAMDGLGNFVVFLIIFSAVVLTLLSYPYLEKHDINKEEYYVLILLCTLGATSLAVANHFVSFILGLELLSISLYIMIGYLKVWDHVIEAAIKYLVLASVSSAFLLMGMALLYAATGSMDFSVIGERMANASPGFSILLPAGIGLIIVGAGFKMALVPFHMWAPDVYQGSPAPTAGFIASASKGAIIAVMLRFYLSVNGSLYPSVVTVLSLIAVLSMLTGNVLALMQNNVKRILGYSSIAHFGYILVSFIAGGAFGSEAVSFYLLAYFISILGAFGVIILMSGNEKDAQDLSEFRSMFWKNPWKAVIFAAMLLSLAGIPLTAGFIGKFYLLSAGISAGNWYLSLTLIVTSVIGLFYYLRIIVEMFKESDQAREKVTRIQMPAGGGIVLSVLLFLLLWIGLYPGMIARLIQFLVGNFMA